MLLEGRGIEKSFQGVRALQDVSLSVPGGEVLGLLGENGAGKSTLIKILTGLERPDRGVISCDGVPMRFADPRAAQRAGIAAVYQEINLIPERSVASNLFLNRAPMRGGWFIDRARMLREARALLEHYGLDIDPAATLRLLGLGAQQLVAIVRTVSLGARVVILDEPTSALSAHEVSILFGIVRRLRADGIGMIYVSHRLSECYALCDRMVVLRDGRIALNAPTADIDPTHLVSAMLGRTLETHRRPAPAASSADAEAPRDNVLRVEHIQWRGRVVDVSLDVRRGEIVGLAGLLGAGRTETMKAVYGASIPEAGHVAIAGRVQHGPTPRASLEAGLTFLSEDRRTEGIFPHLSVGDNLAASVLPRLSRFGVIDAGRRDALIGDIVRDMGVKTAHAGAPIETLSGGNQQKVLIGRALSTDPAVVMFDDPTRGIDVGAKAEIHHTIRALAERGLGVLVTSSEVSEIAELADRVVILNEGRVVDMLPAGRHDVDDILARIADTRGGMSSGTSPEGRRA